MAWIQSCIQLELSFLQVDTFHEESMLFLIKASHDRFVSCKNSTKIAKQKQKPLFKSIYHFSISNSCAFKFYYKFQHQSQFKATINAATCSLAYMWSSWCLPWLPGKDRPFLLPSIFLQGSRKFSGGRAARIKGYFPSLPAGGWGHMSKLQPRRCKQKSQVSQELSLSGTDAVSLL